MQAKHSSKWGRLFALINGNICVMKNCVNHITHGCEAETALLTGKPQVEAIPCSRLDVCGIYKIVNLVNGKLYIEQSVNIKKRFMDHRTPRAQKKHLTISRAIKKYGRDNFSCEVIEECVEEQLNEREIYWISTLKPAYNRTPGGIGAKGHHVSEEAKAILSIKGKEQWKNEPEAVKHRIIKHQLIGPLKGHPVSKKTRALIRNANLGKKQSLATIKKRSESQKQSMLGNKNGSKKVCQFTLDGEYVKTHPSVKEAAKALGIHNTMITHVLRGQRNKTGGFLWRYAENVETNGDECTHVGGGLSFPSKRVATYKRLKR